MRPWERLSAASPSKSHGCRILVHLVCLAVAGTAHGSAPPKGNAVAINERDDHSGASSVAGPVRSSDLLCHLLDRNGRRGPVTSLLRKTVLRGPPDEEGRCRQYAATESRYPRLQGHGHSGIRSGLRPVDTSFMRLL